MCRSPTGAGSNRARRPASLTREAGEIRAAAARQGKRHGLIEQSGRLHLSIARSLHKLMKSLQTPDITKTCIGAIWSMNITPSGESQPAQRNVLFLTFDETQVTFLSVREGSSMRKRTISGLLLLTALLLGVSLPLQAQSWSFAGSLQQARASFTATLLNNGLVLVVGGTYRGTFVQYGLASAELYH